MQGESKTSRRFHTAGKESMSSGLWRGMDRMALSKGIEGALLGMGRSLMKSASAERGTDECLRAQPAVLPPHKKKHSPA